MSSSKHSAIVIEPAGERSALLPFALKVSIVGIIAGVVLLGYVPATRPHMYAVVGLCLVLYLLARGSALLRAIASYAAADVLLLRWAFVLWALASLFWVGRGGEAAERAVTLIEIHMVGAVVFDAARNLGHARWILAVVFVSTAVGGFYSLATGSLVGASRLEGAYGNPNTLAVTSLVGLAVFYAGIDLGRSAWRRGISHVLAGGLMAAVLASSSLKGLVGLAFMWTLGLLDRAGRRRASIQIALAAAIGGVLVTSVDAFQVYWERTVYRVAAAFVTLSTSANFGQSLVKRGRLIGKGIDLLARSPVFGHGLDSFRWMSGEQTYAHNNYIDLGVALGLVGVTLFYGFYARLFFEALRGSNRQSSVGRFLLIMIPMMMLLEIGAVTYVMKTVSFVLLAAAGWLELQRAADYVPVAASPTDAGGLEVQRWQDA
jgi:hypothetical protein